MDAYFQPLLVLGSGAGSRLLAGIGMRAGFVRRRIRRSVTVLVALDLERAFLRFFNLLLGALEHVLRVAVGARDDAPREQAERERDVPDCPAAHEQRNRRDHDAYLGAQLRALVPLGGLEVRLDLVVV